MIRKSAWFAFSGFLLLSSFVLGQTVQGKTASKRKVENGIRQLEDQRFRAMMRADTVALDRLLASDLIYTHSSGRVETKDQFLASLASGELKYESVERTDLRVRVYGTTAVVTGRATMRVHSRGQPTTLEIRFIDVYVKRNGRWQMAAWQSTRLAP